MTKTSHFNYHGLKHGYRSGLEEAINKQLEEARVCFTYEDDVIHYNKPASSHKYTPDFTLIKGEGAPEIYIETKGRFTIEDRKKHLLIKEQHPYVDLRFVFTNPNNRISKKSKTTYAMWCDKHGFKYAHKTIPQEWLNEL